MAPYDKLYTIKGFKEPEEGIKIPFGTYFDRLNKAMKLIDKKTKYFQTAEIKILQDQEKKENISEFENELNCITEYIEQIACRITIPYKAL